MGTARPYERKSPRLPRAQREQQLLDVAEHLFIERGYEHTTIEEIANAAGVSRPVVYHHYGSKEGIYLACVRRARDVYRHQLARALANLRDPREQVRAGGDLFFSILEQDSKRWTVLFGGSAVPLFGDLGEKLTELRFDTVAEIAALIRSGAPNADPERVEAFAHAISGVGEQLGRWWQHNPHIPRQRLTQHYTDFICDGLEQLREQPAPASEQHDR